jgi:esterase/lipase
MSIDTLIAELERWDKAREREMKNTAKERREIKELKDRADATEKAVRDLMRLIEDLLEKLRKPTKENN